MSRITSENLSTLTVKNVPDEIHQALADGDESKSETVREILREWHDSEHDTDPDVYHPSDDQLAEVYAAVWDICNDDLIISMRRHGPTLRQRTQTDESGLRGALLDLQRQGYISRCAAWPGASDRTNESYRVKPPCADPDQWIYRRQS